MSKIQMELMEMFELSMMELDLKLDFAFNKEVGYTDKLTVMMYASFVEGVKNTMSVLTMSENID